MDGPENKKNVTPEDSFGMDVILGIIVCASSQPYPLGSISGPLSLGLLLSRCFLFATMDEEEEKKPF